MLKMLFLVVCAAICSVQSALASQPFEQELDQEVAMILQRWHVPGASLAHKEFGKPARLTISDMGLYHRQ